jgi:hypothetical protein
VYSGHPFQVEVGLVYGGDLPKDSTVKILRFANRVPLLYQQGGCAVTHAIEKVNWRRYGLDQRGGKGIPHGPMLLMVHVASTQVPFTSESKEAIADDPTILTEVDKALREIGRNLKRHVKKKERLAKMKDKEDLIRQVLPHIAKKSATILDRPVPPIEPIIAKIMNMVLLDGEVTYEPKAKRHKVGIKVTNYTRAAKTFTLYSLLSKELLMDSPEPRPKALEEDLVGWRLSRMPVGSVWDFWFYLNDTEADDFSVEDLDLYVEDLDPEMANGVEAWDQDAYDDMHRDEGEHPEGWVEVDESGVEGEDEEEAEASEDGPGPRPEAKPETAKEDGTEEEPEPDFELEEFEDGAAEEVEEEVEELDDALDDLEEPPTPVEDLDELDDVKPKVNGATAGTAASAPANAGTLEQQPLKVAKVKGPEEAVADLEAILDNMPKKDGDKGQTVLGDQDDEFRMEVSD